jgi:hypothetical protein
VLVVLALVGCEPDRCPTAGDDSDSAPRITDFRLHGGLEGDPWTQVFAVEFQDSDGNLSGGDIEFYLNGRLETPAITVADLFRAAALPLDATTGALAVPLVFKGIADGTSTWLALQFLDANRERSNCYALDVAFAVEDL